LGDKLWPYEFLSTLMHEWDARVFCQHFMYLLVKGVMLVLRNTLSNLPPEC